MADEDTVLEEAMSTSRKPGSASERLRASCVHRVWLMASTTATS